MKQILHHPVISEKSRAACTAENVYSFIIHRDATRPEVKKAIQTKYGVTVTDIRIMNEKKRGARWRGMIGGMSRVKKALVKLKTGDTIEIFQV